MKSSRSASSASPPRVSLSIRTLPISLSPCGREQRGPEGPRRVRSIVPCHAWSLRGAAPSSGFGLRPQSRSPARGEGKKRTHPSPWQESALLGGTGLLTRQGDFERRWRSHRLGDFFEPVRPVGVEAAPACQAFCKHIEAGDQRNIIRKRMVCAYRGQARRRLPPWRRPGTPAPRRAPISRRSRSARDRHHRPPAPAPGNPRPASVTGPCRNSAAL